ncbi:MAG: MFS transporter [Thermoplasmata archaeon]
MEKRTFHASSIILSRAVYAINWYNVSPLFILISSSLAISLSQLGLVPAFFLLGAGIFQIPAGIISSVYGPKRTAMFGMYVLSIFTILSGFAWNLYSILFFRLMVGVGAAFYFSPAIGILKNLFDQNRVGLAMGFYNAAFNLGAGIAVLSWGMVAQFFGWREALIISGIFGLAITIENHLTLPEPSHQKTGKIKKILTNRNVIFLGIAMAGFWGAYFATAQFLFTYLVKEKEVSVMLAGSISSLILFSGIIGGPIGGYIHDVIGKGKLLLAILGILSSLLIGLIFLANTITVFIISIMIGIVAVGIFSILYAMPARYQEIPEEFIPLSIGMINSLQISIGSIAPYLFAFISERFSFTFGWVFLSIFVLAFLPILIMIK